MDDRAGTSYQDSGLRMKSAIAEDFSLCGRAGTGIPERPVP